MPDTKTLGAKGQIVIPKRLRELLGIRRGSKVVVEERGEREIVIRPVESSEQFVARFCDTGGRKLRRRIDLKRLYEEEIEERGGGGDR